MKANCQTCKWQGQGCQGNRNDFKNIVKCKKYKEDNMWEGDEGLEISNRQFKLEFIGTTEWDRFKDIHSVEIFEETEDFYILALLREPEDMEDDGVVSYLRIIK